MSLDSDKAQLRQRTLSACREIPSEQAERSAERVARHVVSSAEFGHSATIALYAASGPEIATQSIFEASRRAGKCCVFPRCCPGRRLDFVEIHQLDQLKPGRFGILEPEAEAAAVPLVSGDLVLVPGVAFDRRGGRVGRGGGYYDRAFPIEGPPGPFLMALAHPVQLVDAVPVGANDRRMDAVVTESGIIRIE